MTEKVYRKPKGPIRDSLECLDNKPDRTYLDIVAN